MSQNKFNKKAEEWGNVKFKPTLNSATSNRTSLNPFSKPGNFNKVNSHDFGDSKRERFQGRSNNKFGQNRGGKFQNNNRGGTYHKDKERVRFNATARDAKPESATPWTKFKDEINHKQREENQAAQQANMDTAEGQRILKQREMNYRKQLMEQKQKEPTVWEDFGEEGGEEFKQSKKKKFESVELTQTLDGNDKTLKNNKTNSNKKSKKKQNEKCTEVQVPQNKFKKHHKVSEDGQTPDNFAAKVNEDKVRKNKKKQKLQQQQEQVETNDAEGNVNIITEKKLHKKKQLKVQNKQENDREDIDSGTQNKKKRKHSKLDDEEALEIKDVKQSKKKRRKDTDKTDSRTEEVEATDNVKNISKNKFGNEEHLNLESSEALKNFEANKLSFQQKDNFRALLTKGITFKYGTNLVQCLKNRKRQLKKKQHT